MKETVAFAVLLLKIAVVCVTFSVPAFILFTMIKVSVTPRRLLVTVISWSVVGAGLLFGCFLWRWLP